MSSVGLHTGCTSQTTLFFTTYSTGERTTILDESNTSSLPSTSSLLALNGGGRFLSPSSPLSSLLCSLVSWETLSALLSKLKYYGLTSLLMQLTLSKLGFRGNLTDLTERSQPAIRWRVGEVANRVSCGSFRGGHWYLPIRNHDNRYFADWIRLCPGLSKNSENGNSCPKPHKAARMIEAVGRAVSIETEL